MPDDIEAQVLLSQDYCVALVELAANSGFSPAELQELVELGALDAREDETGWRFTAQCVELARTAQQLRADFELSLPEVALLLAYRERVRELEQRLRDVECLLP